MPRHALIHTGFYKIANFINLMDSPDEGTKEGGGDQGGGSTEKAWERRVLYAGRSKAGNHNFLIACMLNAVLDLYRKFEALVNKISTSGLVVKSMLAMHWPPVRFRAGAIFFFAPRAITSLFRCVVAG